MCVQLKRPILHYDEVVVASLTTGVQKTIYTAAMIGAVYALKDGIGKKWVMIGSDMCLYPKFVGTVFFSMSSPGIVSLHLYSVDNGESNVQFLD